MHDRVMHGRRGDGQSTFADVCRHRGKQCQRVTQIELTMRVLDELRCVEILTNVDEQAILLQCCSVAVRVGMVCG